MQHAAIDEGASGKNARKFTSDDLVGLLALVLSLTHFLAQVGLHLINTSNLVLFCDKLIYPVVERALGHTNHAHVDSIGHLEVELLVADSGVILVKFVELALLEEHNGIPKVLLDLPVLTLER